MGVAGAGSEMKGSLGSFRNPFSIQKNAMPHAQNNQDTQTQNMQEELPLPFAPLGKL